MLLIFSSKNVAINPAIKKHKALSCKYPLIPYNKCIRTSIMQQTIVIGKPNSLHNAITYINIKIKTSSILDIMKSKPFNVGNAPFIFFSLSFNLSNLFINASSFFCSRFRLLFQRRLHFLQAGIYLCFINSLTWI